MHALAGGLGRYTIEDIYALPDGQRAELIDGALYRMAAPNRMHQELVMELTYLIKDYTRNKNGGCKVYAAPFAVFFNADDQIYLEPDISVICDKNKLTDKGCFCAVYVYGSSADPAQKKVPRLCWNTVGESFFA